jgi:serine protease Do
MPTRLLSSWFVRFVAVFTFGTSLSSVYADESPFTKPAPKNPADLRAIEERVTSLVPTILPSVVALQVGPAQASGVIVSSDGYVLTAAHVIEQPGRNVTIIFSDGKTAHGKTLGLNPQVDGGLVQITDQGPWPYSPIAPRDEAAAHGDWCLALGHPGGFQAGRTPPVRLGRVIDMDRAIIRTDCTISMGDSGGPLFDMQGRVIGIHSRIADETTMNLHVPASTYQDAWEVLKAGEVARQPSRFLTRFDTNGDGKINRAEVPEGYRTIFDRIVLKLDLDPEKTYAVEDLSKSLGLESSPGFDGRQLLLPMRFMRPGESLAPERFAHGRAVRSAFTELVGETCHCIVRVKCKGDEVALGTIVSPDGWIVTKASELTAPNEIMCVLDDHRELPARLISADSGHDVAILRVQATELSAVQFSAASLRPGMWLASLGQSERPLAIGVVSIAERAIAGTPGVLGILIDDVQDGAEVKQVMLGSGAAMAGIRVGDVITHVAGESVRGRTQLQTAVRKYRVGEVVVAAIQRDGMKLDLAVRLGSIEDTFSEARRPGRRAQDTAPTWRGAVSQRRDDFPAAIQHDTVLRPDDCGGPILDSAGHVIGINIARADRTASYALPGATILALLDKIKATDAALRIGTEASGAGHGK